MANFLVSVDKWFLVLLVVLLGGYFLYSIKQMFANLQGTLKELKDLIKELFENRNDHESRIKELEVRIEVCASCNSTHSHKRSDDR